MTRGGTQFRSRSASRMEKRLSFDPGPRLNAPVLPVACGRHSLVSLLSPPPLDFLPLAFLPSAAGSCCSRFMIPKPQSHAVPVLTIGPNGAGLWQGLLR